MRWFKLLQQESFSKRASTLANLAVVGALGFTVWQIQIAASGVREAARQAAVAADQLTLQRKMSSADLMLKFTETLDDPSYREISDEVYYNSDESSPLLEEHEGPVSEPDIDRLLGVYELIAVAHKQGLLDESMLYNAFGGEILTAFRNPEIWDYVTSSRASPGGENYFTGFESLGRELDIGTVR
jgi:hypothetical protein